MKADKLVFLFGLFFCFIGNFESVLSAEIAGGYSKEFRDNTNLVQYEGYLREPLPYEWEFGSGLKVNSAAEFGVAMIQETHSEHTGTPRFSVMPQLIISPYRNVDCILGAGTGFMIGETDFTRHNLGGQFLFASKIGFQLLVTQNWKVGYFFFHQSNAGIYEYNASLNMHQLAFAYTF